MVSGNYRMMSRKVLATVDEAIIKWDLFVISTPTFQVMQSVPLPALASATRPRFGSLPPLR